MATKGLVRKPHYEEVLNLAYKDATSQQGILAVPMQRFATELVNSPLFQRIQATLGDALEADQRRVIEQRTFENQLHHVAVEARVPRDDLQWLVENLQRPAPAPPAPPPTTDLRVDWARARAELDGALQRHAVSASHDNLAAEIVQEMARQRVATPIQQVVHQHHSTTVINPPQAAVTPPATTLTEQARFTGRSVAEIFAAQPHSSPLIVAPPLPPPPKPPPSKPPPPAPTPNPAPPFVPNPPVPKPRPNPPIVPGPKPKPNPKPRPGPYPFTNPPKLPPPAPPPPAPRPAPWPRPAPGPVIPDVPIVPIPGLPPPGKAGGAGYLTPVSGVMRLDPTVVPVPTRQARNRELAARATQRMQEIGQRARHEATQATQVAQDLAQNDAVARRAIRGGAPGNVVPVGVKRTIDQVGNARPGILRRQRPRRYGPGTTTHNIGT